MIFDAAQVRPEEAPSAQHSFIRFPVLFLGGRKTIEQLSVNTKTHNEVSGRTNAAKASKGRTNGDKLSHTEPN